MKQLATLSLVIAAACGGKSPPPAPPAQGSAHAMLPDVPFEDLDNDQRHQFMKERVVPTMKPLFQAHDAKDFADFGCATCHGKDAEKNDFAMPNAELPKLDFGDLSKFKQADLEWMKTDIMPTMAKLLRLPVFTHENPKGFGCLGCHTQQGQ